MTFRRDGAAAAGAPASLHYEDGRAVICCESGLYHPAADDLAALASWLAGEARQLPDGAGPDLSVTVIPVAHDLFTKYYGLHPAICYVSPGHAMLAVCARLISDDRAAELGQLLASYLSRLRPPDPRQPA